MMTALYGAVPRPEECVPRHVASSPSSTAIRRPSGWLGSVRGHRTRALGVSRFGQTGTIADLHRHLGIDARGIVTAARAIAPDRQIRHLRRV